jgi:hypothetical protein
MPPLIHPPLALLEGFGSGLFLLFQPMNRPISPLGWQGMIDWLTFFPENGVLVRLKWARRAEHLVFSIPLDFSSNVTE